MSKEFPEINYWFKGLIKPPVLASMVGVPWAKKITAAVGAPTVQTSGGVMQLALEATNEVQNACLYMGDDLSFSIDAINQVDIWASITASLAASVTASFGLASARNDDPEAITAFALFKLEGSNTVKVSTDDNVVDTNSVSTGDVLGTTLKRFTIEFGPGINTQAGALSTGGKSRVWFSMDDTRGQSRRVCPNTVFDMSNYSSGLQLFAQIQKTAAAAVGTLSIERMRIKFRQ